MQSIGEGAYGRVSLAVDKTSGKQVAIKEVNKDHIAKVNKAEHVFREKELLFQLAENNCPHIIRLLKTDQVSQIFKSNLNFILLFRMTEIYTLFLKMLQMDPLMI